MLPPELIHEVLQHFDKSELPNLALVNIAFQSQAEYLLYRIIILNDSVALVRIRSCLGTLGMAPQKAAIVRSFQISQWPYGDGRVSNSTLRVIRKCLLAMTSLEYLCLRLPADENGYVCRVLNPILRRCTFSITTLHISGCLDLAGWLLKQTALKTIVVFNKPVDFSDRQLSLYTELIHSRPNDPITFYWAWAETGRSTLNTVLAFPAFFRGWSARDIHTSLHPLQESYFITDVYLLLASLLDDSQLRPVITSISQHFPQVTALQLFVLEPDIHTHPGNFSSILSLLPELETLSISYAIISQMYRGDLLALARSWAVGCPKLKFIQFPDGTQIYPGLV